MFRYLHIPQRSILTPPWAEVKNTESKCLTEADQLDLTAQQSVLRHNCQPLYGSLVWNTPDTAHCTLEATPN
jgi:hypothetical protein